jgi:hypothetical protein
MLFRPEIAGPICELTEIAMRGPNTLTPGERELIGTYVSTRKECYFRQTSHRAAAAHHLDKDYELVDAVRGDPDRADQFEAESAAGLFRTGTKRHWTQHAGLSVGKWDVCQPHRLDSTFPGSQ